METKKCPLCGWEGEHDPRCILGDGPVDPPDMPELKIIVVRGPGLLPWLLTTILVVFATVAVLIGLLK